jgi:CheY-like chemotaxis protein
MSAPRIFIADDNSDELFLIQRALHEHGFDAVQSVADGSQAIDRISRALAGDESQPLPEIMVLDLHMPNYNGFEVLRWIKSMQISAPVIMHTSSEEPFDQKQAFELGAAAFTTKRAGYRPLIETLRDLNHGSECSGRL